MVWVCVGVEQVMCNCGPSAIIGTVKTAVRRIATKGLWVWSFWLYFLAVLSLTVCLIPSSGSVEWADLCSCAQGKEYLPLQMTQVRLLIHQATTATLRACFLHVSAHTRVQWSLTIIIHKALNRWRGEVFQSDVHLTLTDGVPGAEALYRFQRKRKLLEQWLLIKAI